MTDSAKPLTASEREALIKDLRVTGIELAERAAAELSHLAKENARWRKAVSRLSAVLAESYQASERSRR